MKKILSVFLAILSILTVAGCSSDQDSPQNSRDYFAMGTFFSIRTGDVSVEGTSSSADIDDIFDGCEALTAELDNALSATKEGADVHSFNSGVTALFDADPVFIDVLGMAIRVSELTNSAYDPTIGALTSLWNVKGGGPVPTEDQIRGALLSSGIDHIEIKDNGIYKSNPALEIDLGGIGKGYAAQKLTEYLFENGVTYGIISAGRNVGVFGEKPDGSAFKIGIADPRNTDGVVGYLYTESGFISVAGDYEQFFEENGVRYHHIMDPSTGYPSDSGLSSVAVLSQNGASADALSTALMVMGYEKGIEFYESEEMPFEAVFIFTDGTVKYTDGLADGKFEMSDDYDPEKTVATVYTESVADTTVDTTVPNTTAGETSAKG